MGSVAVKAVAVKADAGGSTTTPPSVFTAGDGAGAAAFAAAAAAARISSFRSIWKRTSCTFSRTSRFASSTCRARRTREGARPR